MPYTLIPRLLGHPQIHPEESWCFGVRLLWVQSPLSAVTLEEKVTHVLPASVFSSVRWSSYNDNMVHRTVRDEQIHAGKDPSQVLGKDSQFAVSSSIVTIIVTTPDQLESLCL